MKEGIQACRRRRSSSRLSSRRIRDTMRHAVESAQTLAWLICTLSDRSDWLDLKSEATDEGRVHIPLFLRSIDLVE